jgi:hypothetical protein
VAWKGDTDAACVVAVVAVLPKNEEAPVEGGIEALVNTEPKADGGTAVVAAPKNFVVPEASVFTTAEPKPLLA